VVVSCDKADDGNRWRVCVVETEKGGVG